VRFSCAAAQRANLFRLRLFAPRLSASDPDGYNSHCNDGQPHAHDKNIRDVIWLGGLQD
jgi:hypothetical protein